MTCTARPRIEIPRPRQVRLGAQGSSRDERVAHEAARPDTDAEALSDLRSLVHADGHRNGALPTVLLTLSAAAIMSVIFVDDPTFLQPMSADAVLPIAPVPTPADVLPFAPGLGPTLWDEDGEPARVLSFSRPASRAALSDAVVDDLGRLLGELLVARWRRETSAE